MTKYPPPKKYDSRTGQAQWDDQYDNPYKYKWPPYRGRFELSHGIQDDHIWGVRNYISWDPEKNAKGWSRQPFWIVDDPIRPANATMQRGVEIIPIFMPVEVQYIRDTLIDFFDFSMREIRSVERGIIYQRTYIGVARRFDAQDDWPIYDVIDRKRGNTRAPSRGVWVLKEKANQQLGKAVADILVWHNILAMKDPWGRGPEQDRAVMLDRGALDTWAVAATMLAEGAMER